ncbi:MAG: cysteine--tRNA ligase [Candidatus Yanofskybacteria bacterium RIFCSPLOWO2_01_FULL_41_34]|uniref:Cysteine--tRNA ligase n=1 Tax=Candidatus Yanofskybacteria bacterium RIFCSPHIGHO2_01_FULL_41_26 TaxID=1802661 RepID=A0A1F8EE79_9BACT|nr:MAG: cysteine--tRNA ligase [Candidatus Yanofskybacteria bacterium RIFCSPHIGHO2_01_FULL_41_26]OGN22953.1 MAG: cysteine--tRNA ligase [Candidatus Yanofskybacteria bacterium RIFCSPLOWO2_01_FULL_41_34]
MKIYNTLTKTKEEFKPRDPAGKKVQMFVCGPTVYDHSHIGHARTYVFFDVVAKYLRYRGYKVTYLMNITDIEDRIIDRAQRDGKSVKELVRIFEKSFLEDTKALKIDSVNKYTRATGYIKQIVKQVETLLEKGHAYKIDGDGYYFDLSTFPDYGKLAHRTANQAEDAISRIDESVNKKNKGDFTLWKFSKPNEPSWKSSLGTGRPGWHIEDTAITDYHFGSQYDLHGGAVDLVFPHHEAEIAQQESASGKKPFVKYWLHPGFLTVKEQKMSKSLGNFITIKDALKNYSPETIRFMVLSNYYRSPLDYNDSVVNQSQAAVQRIAEFIQKLSLANGNNDFEISDYRRKFEEAMDDDFNTARVIALIFDLTRKVNSMLVDNSLNRNSAKKIRKFLQNINSVLGIIPAKQEKIPDSITKLIQKREELRQENNYEEADKIRAQIEDRGYQVDDTVYGSLVTKK